jgi:hypothetical protein
VYSDLRGRRSGRFVNEKVPGLVAAREKEACPREGYTVDIVEVFLRDISKTTISHVDWWGAGKG